MGVENANLPNVYEDRRQEEARLAWAKVGEVSMDEIRK